MTAWTDADWGWMRQALELAERGRGSVEPNPLVGAIVVRKTRVVGDGWHERFGSDHAEVRALAAAGPACEGATLYVTLEPCCHHGKTPPCTEAILRTGIRRVVAAMVDPFPPVAGQGLTRLREAGIEVEVGLGEIESRRLNAPYLKLLKTGRPYVHAKWAMTLDGKIASRTGDARWISNEASRQQAHVLRGRMDAIVVGIGTVLADDPLLTARPPGPRTPTRVILDRHGRLPRTSQLAATARRTSVLIAAGPELSGDRMTALQEQGCEVVRLPTAGDTEMIGALLDLLGQRRMTNILVEGGAAVLGSFLGAHALDEVHVFIAPRLLGGQGARTPIGGQGFERIAEALPVLDWTVKTVQGDVWFHGRMSADQESPP